MQSLTIRRPDDWHVHLRDGEMLRFVAPYTARQFARAIVMPNLVPPVTTVEAARGYRERIREAAGPGFEPLMTCYLTDQADAAEIARGYEQGVWTACKLYPANATTNSAYGVTDIRNIYPALERMQEIGMVFCVHGEVTDPDVDVFDREAVFIERVLTGIVRDFPALKIVLEHITTAEAAQFVRDAGPNVAATITPQHLAPQPQCTLRRRPAAARLLPAGREAGEASARGEGGGRFGLAEILPWHGQRAASARREGVGLRLRRHLQRAVRARKLCDRVRGRGCSRQAGGLRLRAWRALLRVAAERRYGDA